jgi:diguanylate cyclase (GGDEF)-like protein/PAS domain S-box-containing protein
MLAKLQMGPRDIGAVLYADGVYMARSHDLQASLGKSVGAGRPFIGGGAAVQGVYRDIGIVDKVKRVFAWQKLSHYPLIVVIGLDEEALLAPVEQTIVATRTRSAIVTGFLLLLTAALSLLLMRAARQQKLLQDSEARLDELAELSHTWAWEVNADGLYTYASHVVQDVLSYRPDELVGKKYFYELHPEDGRDAFKEKTLEVFANRDPFVNFVNPVSAKDGTVLWVSTNGIPVVDDDGRLLGYRGSDTDITERRQAEAELSHSLSLTNAALDSTEDGILLIDLEGQIVRWNQRFVELWRVPAELLDTTVNDPVLGYALTQVSDADAFLRKVMELYGRPEDSSFDILPMADGRIFERHSQPFRIDGEVKGRFWAFRDITERQRAEEALQKSEANYRKLFSEMLDGFAHHEIICDDNGHAVDYRFLAINPAFTTMLGFKSEDLIGRTALEVLPGIEQHWIERFGKVALTGEADYFEHYSGVWDKHFQVTAFQPEPNQFACIFADVTERKRSEELINQLAFFDQLTALPNRTLLQDRVRQAMAASARNGNHGALLLIDLDNFKSLNDTLGHDMGDILLKQVALRLSESVRAEDTVARLGGDEFVVMLLGLSENQAEAASQTELVGEKIQAVLNLVYQLNDISYKISPSIGVSLFQGYQTSFEHLLKQSDLAMYRAKDAGRNTLRFFDPEMENFVMNRAKLEAELRESIQNEHFVLHYQPQMAGSQVTGCEALVRWQHPVRGMVSPNEFISLAEETGLILPLGRWVMHCACAQLAAWADRPEMASLTISVNVSVHQFIQPDFVDQVLALLKATGARPDKLKLELTETLLATNIEDVVEKMFALRGRGVGFSLDDFGTGYSSLSYLKRLPLEQLKIDQSFVRDILIDPNDASIAKTIIALGRSLGLAVIAEGVENATQRDFLAEHGCHAYQGYFFSRPLPIAEFEDFIRQA